MPLHPVFGHEALRNRLAGAIATGRFPQSVLLSGPAGVGKQRVALWIAQALLCDKGAATPCGECGACRKVGDLTHPDLHWFVPIPRPKSTDHDRQVDEANETLGEAIAARRSKPVYQPPEGLASHSIASIRLLQRRIALTPFMAKRKIVILGDAERLVVQESSPEAANALLKMLEEPPADTVLLLTAAEPQALLPTIRSRLVPIRLQRLSDQQVRAFLETVPSPPLKGAALERAVTLSEGSIGRALESADESSSGDRSVDRWLAAVRKGPRSWADAALAQQPWSARGDFTALLDGVSARLRSQVTAEPARAAGYLAALRRIEEIRADAQGNANPQLALAVLACDVETLL